jgi:thymidylate synthase
MRVFSVYDKFGSEVINFTELYQEILYNLINNCEYQTAPRGLPIREFVNATVSCNPSDVTIDFTKTGVPERQEVYDRYKKAEHEWYLSGNTLASSAPSKFWNQLAGQDGHITSNYGHMILVDKKYPNENREEVVENGIVTVVEEYLTAFEKVVATLAKDLDSRQAIIHYNEPRHCRPSNKDFPCTMYSQFFVRDGVLNMTTYQRSCDAMLGFSYDVPWSSYVMKMVCEALNKQGLNIKIGNLTMVFGSLHLYEKNLELAEKIISAAK